MVKNITQNNHYMKNLSTHITESFINEQKLAYTNLEWNEMQEDYAFTKEENAQAKKYANLYMSGLSGIPERSSRRQMILDWSKDKAPKEAKKFFHDRITCFILFEQYILRAWEKGEQSVIFSKPTGKLQ